jgi:hypothetical protein
VVTVDDTELTCTTGARTAGVADVVVNGVTLANGYTYTDALTLAPPTQSTSIGEAVSYRIETAYSYTGTVTLSDGGVGGTFTGLAVSGNTLAFNNTSGGAGGHNFNYTPPAGYAGVITIKASAGVAYVQDASATLTVLGTGVALDCSYTGYGGAVVADPFVNPGTRLYCWATLNGPYAGTVTVADLLQDSSPLGGTITSTDSRFAGGVFTTTMANTTAPNQRVLEFTYVSPSWTALKAMCADANCTNGLDIFWPTLTATLRPVLTVSTATVPVGLLAQEYRIASLSTPPIDDPGEFGCLGCVARFEVSTFGAPYEGTITLSSDKDGEFSIGAYEFTTTAEAVFGLSGMNVAFRYRPDETGVHTLSGASDPSITDDTLSFVVNPSPFVITCESNVIRRGGSDNCTLDVSYGDGPNDTSPTFQIALSDIFSGADAGDETPGDGVFTDTTGDGTFSAGVYTFCNDNYPANDCSAETDLRTFTYTLPAGTLDKHGVVGIIGTNSDVSPADTNNVWLSIVSTKMDFYCAALSPTCTVSTVGQTQNYALNPDGMFAGTVSVTDNNGGVFSDGGIVSWDYTSGEFVFTYAPASPGLKTLTATVTAVDNPTGSDIEVGDIYTMQVWVLANQATVTGADRLGIGENGNYTLTLNGPYQGTVDLATVTSGVTLSPAACTFALTDYNATTSTTTCTFNMAASSSTVDDYAVITATGVSFSQARKTVAIVASAFELDADRVVLQRGGSVEFTVTLNGLFAGTLNLSDGGKGGTFSPTSLEFSSDDWPLMPASLNVGGSGAASAAPVGVVPQSAQFGVSGGSGVGTLADPRVTEVPCTYTPAQTGDITVTVSDAKAATGTVGSQSEQLLVLADGFTITPNSTTGQTGEPVTFVITPNGPWDGTLVLDDGGAGGTFSQATLVFDSGQGVVSYEVTYTPAQDGEVVIVVSDDGTSLYPIASQMAILVVGEVDGGGPGGPGAPGTGFDTAVGLGGSGAAGAARWAGGLISLMFGIVGAAMLVTAARVRGLRR